MRLEEKNVMVLELFRYLSLFESYLRKNGKSSNHYPFFFDQAWRGQDMT